MNHIFRAHLKTLSPHLYLDNSRLNSWNVWDFDRSWLLYTYGHWFSLYPVYFPEILVELLGDHSVTIPTMIFEQIVHSDPDVEACLYCCTMGLECITSLHWFIKLWYHLVCQNIKLTTGRTILPMAYRIPLQLPLYCCLLEREVLNEISTVTVSQSSIFLQCALSSLTIKGECYFEIYYECTLM